MFADPAPVCSFKRGFEKKRGGGEKSLEKDRGSECPVSRVNRRTPHKRRRQKKKETRKKEPCAENAVASRLTVRMGEAQTHDGRGNTWGGGGENSVVDGGGRREGKGRTYQAYKR